MDLRAEIITIGNELISGGQIDTNGSFLAECLHSRGIIVQRIVSVGDDASSIAQALRESMERADVVLVTGGLGPASEDITTEATARLLGKTLQLYPEALKHIKNLMCSLGVDMTDAQKKQAYFPEGAELIPNPIGSAYGYLIKETSRLLFFLPGVPREMKAMVEETILPRLEKETGGKLDSYIFGVDAETMEEVVGKLLRDANATIAVAESCTGGLIGHRLTNVPGSSDYADQIVVTYSNKAKVDLLNVPEDIINAHGAVSEPTARFMAQGVKNLAGTTLGLATTGIAGPGGGSPDKPVGTVFISLTDGNETWTKSYHFSGDRLQIKQITSQVALNRVRKYLLQKI